MPAALGSKPLPGIWLKAAMLGSLWASFEIVLGSFLHNLHIPFSGTFLAALGVILMINGYKLWPDRGLFWRTALIAAMMKSISPSAIILGPMLGIFMEGVLLEMSTRMFRRHWIGFMLGGALAISWSLVQKILTLLLTYGPDFITLYQQVYQLAMTTLGIQGTSPVNAILLLFLIDMVLGAGIALFAWNSQSVRSNQRRHLDHALLNQQHDLFSGETSAQQFSLLMLFIYLAAWLALMTRLEMFSSLQLSGLVALYSWLVMLRYDASLQRLHRPRLWVGLLLIMVLSGLLLGGWADSSQLIHGLDTGYRMALRAVLVILGLAVLSIELRNPKLMRWFADHGLQVLFDSVRVASEVLPHLLNRITTLQNPFKHPVATMLDLMAELETLRRHRHQGRGHVILLVGDQGVGKTSLLRKLMQNEQLKTTSIAGILTEGVWVNNERDHYFVESIHTGRRQLLCERQGPVSVIRSGPFNFRDSGLSFGHDALLDSLQDDSLIIIDEVGHLELRGSGWASAIEHLIEADKLMIWTVRPSLESRVRAHWACSMTTIHIHTGQVDRAFDALLGALQNLIP